MTLQHHPAEIETVTAAERVTSLPVSGYPANQRLINDGATHPWAEPHGGERGHLPPLIFVYAPSEDDSWLRPCTHPLLKLMCSFGGKIPPRPHDNQLRYVGGETRIVAVHRSTTTFSSLLNKLSILAGTTNISVKYRLPNEDLDALVTLTTDEDVENMMEEYERFDQNNAAAAHPKASRLRLFLFSNDAFSRTGGVSSLLDGSPRREQWFLDALNGGAVLERGRSEASSTEFEVQDYLPGIHNSDEQLRDPDLKTMGNLDLGSTDPVGSSSVCSTSSTMAPPCVSPIPELPPVRTKPNNPVSISDPNEDRVGSAEATESRMQQTGFEGSPLWYNFANHYYPGSALQGAPMYHASSSIPSRNFLVHPVHIQVPYQPVPEHSGQIPVGFHQLMSGMGQIYGGVGRPVAKTGQFDIGPGQPR
ncbi:hypothetical protein U1Q18_010777 [Sarracenia purpurea var. burkii]